MNSIFVKENTSKILMERIHKSRWLQNTYREMLAHSDELLTLNETEFLRVRRGGCDARILGGQITTLFTAGLLSKKDQYTQKALRLLQIALTKDFAFYYSINHHLSVGDAALSLAVCVDLLGTQLSEKEQERAKRLLTDLAEWLHSCNSTWGLPHKGVSSCNHNSVHYAGMGMCGLVLGREDLVQHAVAREKEFLKYAADETGYITEGVGYANYGLTTAIIFCEAYMRTYGVQLLDLPLTCNQFIAHALPIPGKLLQLNDHGDGGQMMPQAYLMNRYHNAAGMHLLEEYEATNGGYFTARDKGMRGGMVFPFLFLFADETLQPTKCTECGVPLTQKFSSGRVMTRTAWDDPMAVYMSVTCGESFHFGHNHADKGSFTVYGLGEEFLIDPGTAAHGGRDHNILMINGITQLRGVSQGKILETRETENSLFVVCDTIQSYEYTPQSLLGMARRNILFVKKPVPFIVIRDDMQVERPIEEQQFFEFMMHTAKGNSIKAEAGCVEITGQNYGNRCRLQFVYPEKVDVQISHEERQQYSYQRWSCCTDCFEEAIAACHAYNPFLTTVITFAQAGDTFPAVSVAGDQKKLIVKVKKDRADMTVCVERYTMKIEE